MGSETKCIERKSHQSPQGQGPQQISECSILSHVCPCMSPPPTRVSLSPHHHPSASSITHLPSFLSSISPSVAQRWLTATPVQAKPNVHLDPHPVQHSYVDSTTTPPTPLNSSASWPSSSPAASCSSSPASPSPPLSLASSSSPP